MKTKIYKILPLFVLLAIQSYAANKIKFIITDSMQSKCYDSSGNIIQTPKKGEKYYGQDAQYQGIKPSYTNNGDGTITDNNTGLVWQKTPPKNKMFYDQAKKYVKNLKLAGYTDWRLPTIKESFSLAMLDGKLDPKNIKNAKPYINSTYFDFAYDKHKPYTGSYWTSTMCKMPVNNTSSNYEKMGKNYGFNWADGHMKSYADGYDMYGKKSMHSIPAGVRAVRGKEGVYGVNDFKDNNDGTIIDKATGLMWSQQDSGAVNDDATIRHSTDKNFGLGRTWTETLAWVEKMNKANYLGHNDWRLPDIKELQSIVQYNKKVIPAINTKYFYLSFPDCFVWSSTTCGDFPEMADYIAFGRGYGIDLMADSEKQNKNNRPPPIENDQEMEMPPPPPENNDGIGILPPPEHQNSKNKTTKNITVKDFVDVHGPGCMRADYKDTQSKTTPIFSNQKTITVLQTPLLSKTFWKKLNHKKYPYPFNEKNKITEFDLSNSENAADYIVIYNYALLVRDIK